MVFIRNVNDKWQVVLQEGRRLTVLAKYRTFSAADDCASKCKDYCPLANEKS